MTTKTKKAKSKIIPLVWHEHEIIQEQARYLLEEGEATDEKDAFEMVCCDSDHIGFEYDDFLEDFSAILKKLSPKGCFHIEGRNMGWRHLSGWSIVEAGDARAFMSRAFPKTSDWTLRGQFDRKRRILTYTLSHHDAPTGELYVVRTCRAEDRRRQ